MRLVQLLLAADEREPILSMLDEEEIDYLAFETAGVGSGARDVLVEFPLPDQAVEYVEERLDEAGIEQRYVVTLTAESARTTRFAELEDRFITGTEAGDSISPEELRTTALSLHPDPVPYYSMTVVSALVAVAGLLVDSAALVVGAMVIAPQVGSALTASVGATIGEWEMLESGVRAQVLSLSLAILGAAAFGIALQLSGFVSPTVDVETIAQVGERTAPGLLTLAVGLAAGVAGAVGLATALPVSIVGVMIAAALIPAAAAVGIGLAWSEPGVAIGAAVLLVANLVSVNVAGFATLRAFGYRPTDADTSSESTLGPALVALALVVAVLGSGALFTAQSSFENDVNSAVGDVLEDDAYDDLELVQTSAGFVVVPGSAPPDVRVVVQRPVDQPSPRLAADLGAAIADATGREVNVRVEFVETQRYDADE
ncbi:DUF389 domain-containing protein [Halobellus rufus]|uniref:DUF389 domain-containing protein n=1 Tax=Halobellus rufus TaxID=1448860 RepID=UPI0006792B9E|nr:DUF389 domain-containing protein [Halobellus rufus]